MTSSDRAHRSNRYTQVIHPRVLEQPSDLRKDTRNPLSIHYLLSNLPQLLLLTNVEGGALGFVDAVRSTLVGSQTPPLRAPKQ